MSLKNILFWLWIPLRTFFVILGKVFIFLFICGLSSTTEKRNPDSTCCEDDLGDVTDIDSRPLHERVDAWCDKGCNGPEPM